MDKNIRLAEDDDFEEIFSIWMDGVSASFDTSKIDSISLQDKFYQNFKSRNKIFNYWVWVDETNNILGWQSLSKVTVNPLKDEYFAESSTYVRKEARHLGIGKNLLDYVMKEAETSQLQYVIGFVAKTNEATRKATRETGFIELGELPDNSKTNFIKKLFIVRPC